MVWRRNAPREKLIERAGLAQRQVADATKLLTDMRATAARPWWRKLLGRTAVLSVALATLMGVGNASGQNPSGNDRLPHCKSETATYSNGVCVGTVRGLLYVAEVLPPNLRFCPPAGGTIGQAMRVVVTDLERNPATLHLEFEKLAIAAFRKAWPCR
jgi:hypothetical protein